MEQREGMSPSLPFPLLSFLLSFHSHSFTYAKSIDCNYSKHWNEEVSSLEQMPASMENIVNSLIVDKHYLFLVLGFHL